MLVLNRLDVKDASENQETIKGYGVRIIDSLEKPSQEEKLSKITFYGWALLNETHIKPELVVVIGENNYVSPIDMHRQDVIDYLGLPDDAANCGFNVTYSLESNPEQIELYIRTPTKDILFAIAYFSQISPKAIQGKDGFLFLGGEDSNGIIEHINGDKTVTEAAINIHSKNLAILDKLKCPYQLVIIPEAHVIYSDKLPEHISISERRPVHTLLDQFKSKIFYPLDLLLEERQNGIEIYSGKDSHWTSLAAQCVYKAMRRNLGIETPYEISFDPKFFPETGDLTIANKLETKQKELNASKYFISPQEWMSVFSAGILNNGNLGYTYNAKGKGRCLAFGTSFSTRLVPYYVCDFQETIFCYGTAIDEAILSMVKPDYVIIELPERFVHFPSTAVSGSTFMGALAASHEKDYAGIALDNTNKPPLRVPPAVIAIRDIINGRNNLLKLSNGINTIGQYDIAVARKIQLFSKIISKIDDARILRYVVSGHYTNYYVLEMALVYIKDRKITAEALELMPDTEMGLACKALLYIMNNNIKSSEDTLIRLEKMFGLACLKSIREKFHSLGF